MFSTTRHRGGSTRALAELDLFNGCGQRELVKLQSLTTPLELPPGRVLTQLGERGREFFVIANGYAEVRRHGQLVATLGPGSFFGEMALLDGGARTATVVAVTPLVVHVFSETEFRQLLAASPTVMHNMLRVMAERLRGAA